MALMNVAGLELSLKSDGFRGSVEHDAAARIIYGTDNSVYQLQPVGAVVPTSIDDLAVIARVNHELDTPFDLVARGGGTGTNGQSLTNGLVVDTRRSMNRIVSIDADAQVAVVQPGVVLGQLNAALQPHGLFFAPHVSTSSRATIGGMVSTDAAGKGSLVYGRTNQHVLGLEAVLADGTHWSAGKVTDAGLDTLAQQPDRLGDVHRLVREAIIGVSSDAFPDVPRGFSGYNLAGATAAAGIDFTKILTGSEGTLALLGEITVHLEPLTREPNLAVIAYPRFEDAVRDSNRLKVTAPIAIECLDERTISLATRSPAFPRLASLLGTPFDASGSLLLMEFDGRDGIHELQDLLAEETGLRSGSTAMAITSDAADIAAVWKVRGDAVGLLGQAVDGRRSIAFVEDCAVPPHRLEEFVASYRSLLDSHGLAYGMFGHADVGCIHVRPALDLYDESHERLLRTISDQVHALVASFGGVLWGEHGRGFRGEYLDLDADTVHRMRQVKTAFDPRNILNPGKLYAPLEGAPPITKIDEVPLRIHSDRSVAIAERQNFDSAFGCNGNGICHHWGEAEVMCPSYKVTLDPRLSPKGRADLLRGWLANPDDAALADDVADSMRQCLSCGACTGRCPVQVDIPELKSRFLERRPERSWRSRARDGLLSRFESLLPKVQAAARVAGPLQRLAVPIVEKGLGVVDLPRLPTAALHTRLAELNVSVVDGSNGVADATVIVLPDVFTAYIDPDVLEAAIMVLRAVGERPALAPFVPSGKFDHVKGRRTRFAHAVAQQRGLIERLVLHDLPLVIIEPAVSLLGAHEYAAIDASFPSDATTSLAEFLEPRLTMLPSSTGRGAEGIVQLFGHCTEVSLAPKNIKSYSAMLEAAGFDVQTEATTCCGMAGIFGHEADNQEMSTALFDMGWRPKLESGDPVHRCASGYSCRSQAQRFGYTLKHPIEVIAAAL
ncbi:MAG: FAD/FMN-containing dehydrogenase/Fe-S oxidoreductase [Ilumatobacter sp.]|jgi:FAD/FMN-containing dehydrogenase/Fe-S oxidoreductase